MSRKQLSSLAARLGDDFFEEIVPKVAVVHRRTGVVAGMGPTQDTAITDAFFRCEVMPGGDWRIEPWIPAMRSRVMEPTP